MLGFTPLPSRRARTQTTGLLHKVDALLISADILLVAQATLRVV